jgi:competence protein ComEC
MNAHRIGSLLFFWLCAATFALAAADDVTRWTMLPVTPVTGQADAHLLEFPGGTRVLVDAGEGWDAPGALLASLQKRNVTHLDLVVLSHFHSDHYGRLLDLIRAGIVVDRVVLNVPDRESADREIPWGCNWEDVQAVLAELRARQIPYATPAAGDSLLALKNPDGTTAGIEVVCCYDGRHTPVGPTDVNDTSIILRVYHGPTRVLFSGDLNLSLGTYLATSAFDLKADLLKVPHHGTEGAAPNEFFDRVGARAVLVPGPKALWESPRSMRIRNYFLEHHTPAYVSGISGAVTVLLDSHGYKVETER